MVLSMGVLWFMAMYEGTIAALPDIVLGRLEAANY